MENLRLDLREGLVIPAHPLALTSARKLDERRQRALTRYYLSAGAGGLAVGVHTTQFAIHDDKVGLFGPVLELAMEEARRFEKAGLRRPVLVAGIVGRTTQALREAYLARGLGYHCGLLSLGALRDETEDAIVEHAAAVGEILPVFGFYLQPAVGGRVLSYRFWRRFVEIDAVVAVKIAPFNRYQTIDVVRAVAESGRAREIALYTGNDDNIVLDLLTAYPYDGIRIVGGLLGHWAAWTRRAVETFVEVRRLADSGAPVPPAMLTRAAEITDANAALFDPQHDFAGCISGIHEVLRRQGLLEGRWTLDPDEDLSLGQAEEIDRICAAYPHLTDDGYVRENLDLWLR